MVRMSDCDSEGYGFESRPSPQSLKHMAEYKTYTCDVCGKKEARHLKIPDVDYSDNPAGGSRQGHNGHVDLCVDHIDFLVTVFFDVVNTTMEQRRAIWKRLLRK
jgi:hypothetical protein